MPSACAHHVNRSPLRLVPVHGTASLSSSGQSAAAEASPFVEHVEKVMT